MPTARELNQKLADSTLGWHSFLAEAHRLVNEADLSAVLNGPISSLAAPSPYMNTEQRITNAVAQLTSLQNRMRDSIAKLRTFLTV